MAKKRATGRDIYIPCPISLDNRFRALSDPEFFATHYFPQSFDEEFTADRRDMFLSIIHAAQYAGDKAIAGSRGEGKTTIAMTAALYLMFAGLSHFPIVVGKSQDKSKAELRGLIEQLQQNERIIQDFPEIGIPFQKVGGWSSRARMQTVGGRSTNMAIQPSLFAFPQIAIDQLDWPEGIEPISNGQIMAAVGIDGPIRGTKYGSQRPELAIIDDIEDRESAASEALIEKIEKIIDEDIAGMGRSAEKIPRVMLCTTQNRKCIAYRYTDPKQKPSWNGVRYRKMIKPPDRMDMVLEYIEMRQLRKADDPDAREAFRYWRDNQSVIESGCIISNKRSYSKKVHADGEPLELSAIQAYYNRVADTSWEAVATEIDNDPPAESGPQGSGLTAEIVSSRLSGLERGQIPASATCVTAAIDIGKYRCHWVITAWWKGAGGVVVDYGVAEVIGTEVNDSEETTERAIYNTLLAWRDELLARELTDASGERRKVDAILIDSGNWTEVVYEFIRQVGGGPFYASKGIPKYRTPKTGNDKCVLGQHLHASYQDASRVWLYDLDTDYWKQFVHERFLTPTFDDANMLRKGALSLFNPNRNKKHLSYAQHIVAEQLVEEFKEGKGVKTYWDKINANNHWLDATYMAAAVASALGVNLLQGVEEANRVTARRVESDRPKTPKPKQHGQQFRSRPGGWVNGVRGRR